MVEARPLPQGGTSGHNTSKPALRGSGEPVGSAGTGAGSMPLSVRREYKGRPWPRRPASRNSNRSRVSSCRRFSSRTTTARSLRSCWKIRSTSSAGVGASKLDGGRARVTGGDDLQLKLSSAVLGSGSGRGCGGGSEEIRGRRAWIRWTVTSARRRSRWRARSWSAVLVWLRAGRGCPAALGLRRSGLGSLKPCAVVWTGKRLGGLRDAAGYLVRPATRLITEAMITTPNR